MIYIASPYNDSEAAIRRQRFEQVQSFTADMISRGYCVLSPICHSHPIAEAYDLPKGFEFWLKVDLELLSACDELWVLMLDGWQESRGVKAEIEYALEHRLKVKYFDPNLLSNFS